MISRKQNLRHLPAVPFLGPRILRIFQQAVAEGVRVRGHFVSENTRDQPRDGVDQHHGRQFSAGEDIVADRNLIGHNFLQYALVNALVVTAQKDQILLQSELLRDFLRKGSALRREIDNAHRRGIAALLFLFRIPLCIDPGADRFEGVINRLRLH